MQNKESSNLLVILTMVCGIVFFGTSVQAAVPNVTLLEIDQHKTTAIVKIFAQALDHGVPLPPIIAKGVCWSKSENPSLSDCLDFTNEGEGDSDSISDDSHFLWTVTEITGLSPGTKYYVRAYATNTVGTGYSENKEFTTDGTPGAPSVTTYPITDYTAVTADFEGNISDIGTTNVTIRGFCWNTEGNPSRSDYNKEVSGTFGSGTFVEENIKLSPGTKYYVKAYAENTSGISYGNEISFTTSEETGEGLDIKTTEISDVTSDGAKIGGEVISNGGSQITERGICWSETSPPDIEDNRLAAGSVGLGAFTIQITKLASGTKYYVRAYADQDNLITYASTKDFTTSSSAPSIPTITTGDISFVTSNSAKCGGNVTSHGGAVIMARGVCWSTASPPTIDDTCQPDNYSELGVFTSRITGLIPGTKYYVKAYVKNSAGTAYGFEKNFTTASSSAVPDVETGDISLITSVNAKIGGEVFSDGGAAITERGFCWSETSPPIIGDNKFFDGSTEIGEFEGSITGLKPLTDYYVRSYAINSKGIGYGMEKSFRTNDELSLPTVTTVQVGSITSHSAVAKGDIHSNGGSPIIEKGICWSESSPPTVDDHKKGYFYSATGVFTTNIGELKPDTKYYLRAYAINDNGTAYGEEKKFFTNPSSEQVPEVQTAEVSHITSRSVIAGGTVVSDGGQSIIGRGICWSDESSPPTIIHNELPDSGSGMGSFDSILGNLIPGTKYYLRAYAINSTGTGYGTERIFITDDTPKIPTVTTEISNFGANGAICVGEVASDGGADITERGICWSETSPPTTDDNKLSDNSSGSDASFSIGITGLSPHTTYYVRAYAINEVGMAYGSEKQFATLGEGINFPVIMTDETIAVTSGGTISGGDVISDGGSEVTERGVCWSETSPATISDNKLVDSSSGTGAFESVITGLKSGMKYYLRAYAKNGKGIGYGNERSFITDTVSDPPTVATTEISALTSESVTCGGEISSDGGLGITERGICWAERPHPTIIDSKLADISSGIAGFAVSITGLNPDTTYYLRAYATNAVGTSYGIARSFTTKAETGLPTVTTTDITAITWNGISSGGNIVSDGGRSITERGICWDEVSMPTIDNNANKLTDDTSGTGMFISVITGLTPATNYYIRAYAINERGVAYGNERNFRTDESSKIPTVKTSKVTGVTLNSAISGGEVISDGGSVVSERGICWNKIPSPTIDDDKMADDAVGTGIFTGIIRGLEAGDIYYIRAYATNSQGTAYGDERNFTTNTDPDIPIVTSAEVSVITSGGAGSGGNVISDGGSEVIERGVCWSKTSLPIISDNRLVHNSSGTGEFTSVITGLDADTTYYIRAYATNSQGTGYGLEKNFKTALYSLPPTVGTHEISAVTKRGGVSGGNVSSDGGRPITERGVCWSDSSPPTIDDNRLRDGLAELGDFAAAISGLNPDTKYYLRAYATNEIGTGYGSEKKFTTPINSWETPPTVKSEDITDIRATSAVCTGNVTSDGGSSLIERGICWSETSLPTVNDNKVADESPGSGPFTGIITGLNTNTIYYVRAYATNEKGTAYGLEKNFITGLTDPPTVVTDELSDITAYSVTCGGTVVSDGGSDIIERGVCWSEKSLPTVSDNKVADEYPDTGEFTVSVTGFEPCELYYLRAYATNSGGTAYGTEKTFAASGDCLSLRDAICALRILVGISSDSNCEADANDDGIIGIEDVILILKILSE